MTPFAIVGTVCIVIFLICQIVQSVAGAVIAKVSIENIRREWVYKMASDGSMLLRNTKRIDSRSVEHGEG